MRSKIIWFTFLLGCGGGRLSSITLMVTDDPIVRERLDAVRVYSAQLSSRNQAPMLAAQIASGGGPLSMPVSLTIKSGPYADRLDAYGCVDLLVGGEWHGVETASVPEPPPCVDFHNPTVAIQLFSPRADLLRHCSGVSDCATAECGLPTNPGSAFCTRTCSTDMDCPSKAACSTKFGSPTCVPRCTTDTAYTVCSANDYLSSDGASFLRWKCDVDGLCAHTN